MPLVTGDEYMDLLLTRQAEWLAANPSQDAFTFRRPPLLEWFVQAGDEDLVDLPSLVTKPQPKRTPKPRTYRSAESLREERDRVQARMDAITRDDCGDMAIVNLSPNARSRAARRAGVRRFEKLDRDLQRYTELKRRLDRLNARLAAAEARESAWNPSPERTAQCPL